MGMWNHHQPGLADYNLNPRHLIKAKSVGRKKVKRSRKGAFFGVSVNPMSESFLFDNPQKKETTGQVSCSQ